MSSSSIGMKTVRTHFVRGANILRKLFRSTSYKLATKVEGHTLNSTALTRSFIAGRKGRENDDRYLYNTRKPNTKCAFSFAIDFSGSMSSSPCGGEPFLGERSDSWTRVIGAIHALTNVAESVGIKSKVGFIQFERGEEVENSRFQSIIIKDWGERAWKDDEASKLSQLSPSSGTCCADYARASIKMLENMSAEYKVAFFLTDGEDSWSRDYYKSLEQHAKSMGIKLVGIAFSNDASLKHVLPNGCLVKNTKELGSVIFRHLEGLF